MKRIKKTACVLLIMTLALVAMLGTLSVSAAAQKPWVAKNVRVEPGYKSLYITWDSSTQKPAIDAYRVYARQSNGQYKLQRTIKPNPNVQRIAHKIIGLQEYKTYYYRVVTVRNGLESGYTTVHGTPIRPMTYYLSLYGGGSRVSTKYSGGKYIDTNGNYISGNRVKSVRGDYTTAMNYTRLSAESFVNDRKFGSSTNQFIWASTYTQHVYLFAKKGGKWKVVDDWECATGKPDTPTPTGLNGRKAIWKKVSSRNGLPYWSAFSSMNSFHGKESGWAMGRPASSGCIRNPNNKAEKIFKGTWMNTGVLIW